MVLGLVYMIGKIIFPKRDETKQTGGSMMAIILPKDLRLLVVLSHNRIEDTSKSEHKILPDEKYDLIHIKTEEVPSSNMQKEKNIIY